MVQWPPSPTVEDEGTALAKEHLNGSQTVSAPSESASVPSRGAVDQQPIIMDSDLSDHAPLGKQDRSTDETRRRRQDFKAGTSSSDENVNSRTPASSSDSEHRGRHSRSSALPNSNAGQRSKSAAHRSDVDTSNPRPPMPRLKTDTNDDLLKVKANITRSRSPYAYTRAAGTFKVDPVTRMPREAPSSTDHVAASPVTVRQPAEAISASPSKPDQDSPTNFRKNTAKSVHSTEDAAALSEAFPSPRRSSTFGSGTIPDKRPASVKRSSTLFLSPDDIHPRRRESFHTSENEPRQEIREQRSRSRPPRSKSKSRESAYDSSTDDSRRHGRSSDDASRRSRDERVRRSRSSHRSERSGLDKDVGSTGPRMRLSFTNDDHTKHVYRIKGDRTPMTPPSVSTPKGAEDYFSRAFAENHARQSRYTPRNSLEEAIAFSPPTSPPRTPQAERAGNQDYFSSPASSPKRFHQGSREPSWDDSQFKEAKSRTSLLSQATSTAARAYPTIARLSTTSLDTGATPSVLPIKAKSRPSSPSRFTPTSSLSRHETYAYPGFSDNKRGTSNATQSNKLAPSSDQLASAKTNVYQPQRNASWAGYNYNSLPAFVNVSQPSQAPHVATAAQLSQPMSDSVSTHPGTEMPPPKPPRSNTDPVLPPCPRPQAVRGYRDWYSFQEAPFLDVCPACIAGLASTKYQQSIIQSPERSPDTSTICALNNPWIRVVISRSLKVNSRSTSNVRKELSLIKRLSQLPEGVRPCRGPGRDVRVWWSLTDPQTKRKVPDFHACSACISSVHNIFTELPEMFRRDDMSQERVCTFDHGSKDFDGLVKLLDQVNMKCIERGRSKDYYMQPFVDQVRRVYMKYTDCSRDAMLAHRGWHFMNELPEFTVCEGCYEQVVWPLRDKHVAKDISKTTKIVPVPRHSTSGNSSGPNMVACQLYSERMRRLFTDVVSGRIPWETFRTKAIERCNTQRRLTEINRMYEQDQEIGFDRHEDIERNKQFWRSIE